MQRVQQWVAAMLARTRGDGELEIGDDGGELSPQQRRAAIKGAHTVERYGGVILADAVGLGKTRTALAMARRVVSQARRRGAMIEPVLFVVPARLRHDWSKAIGEAGWQIGRDAKIVSHHRLSRGPIDGRPPLVVVDEAHRFRTPSAKRSQNLALLTSRAPPILVTATPVCTRQSDLRQLLGYFLSDEMTKTLVGMGLDSAFAAHEAGEFDLVEILQEVVIRRLRPDFGTVGRPGLKFEILRYVACPDEEWLWKNLEARLRGLSFAATGEHWPKGLLVNNLLRMWESGPEALGRSLDELVHFHERWIEAAQNGRVVERPLFRQLFSGVDRRQQVFPFFYGQGGVSDDKRRRAVVDDLTRLEEVSRRVDDLRQGQSGMVEAIGGIIDERQDESFLIFATYQGAAESIFKFLARDSKVRAGLVTGDSARATGLGLTTDREVIRRFREGDKLEFHRRLRVLVTTDCLAEGLNLQGCKNMILADLPYSPVKLEQRIGRIARPGAGVEKVTVYLPRPASWTDSLGMRRRLGARLEMAEGLGAGHQLASVIEGKSTEDEGGPEEVSPLAALTGQERLWQSLQWLEPSTGARFGKVGPEESADLWGFVEVDGATSRYFWICFRQDSQTPVLRLGDQLPWLARLTNDARQVEPWEPCGALWERARRWMERKQAVLDAARLAPPLLGAGSEPVRIWRKISELAYGRAATWRRRLLRPHPPGLIWEMERLLASYREPAELVRFVEGLEDPLDAEQTYLRLVGALLISRSASVPHPRRRPLPAAESASSYSRT